MDSIIQGVFYIAVLLFSIVIHEVAHGYAALFRGDPTAKYAGRLTLNPIKHIDLFGSILVPIMTFSLGGFLFGWAKPVPFNPYNLKKPRLDEVLIAIAGPASNAVIAIISAVLFRMIYVPGTGQSVELLGLLTSIVVLNVSLCVFNLVPIPPLDGSKILFSILPQRFIAEYRQTIEMYALIAFIFFIMFFSNAIGGVTVSIVRMLLGA